MKQTFFMLTVLLISVMTAGEPVYLIHGFMRTSASFQQMATTLQAKGFKPHLWDYPSRDRTIEEHSNVLVHHLQKTARKNQPIHFVTHSMGGLILRAALNNPKCPHEAKIGKAVLIAPPNRGSQYGRALGKLKPMKKYLGSKSGHQLLHSQNFDHLGTFPSSLNILVIAGTLGWNPTIDGPNDGKVSVSETRLNTPHYHTTVPCGHSWIMRAKPTINKTLTFLR